MTTQQQQILEDISKILVDDYGKYPEEVVPDATLEDDMDLDSLDTVEFIMKIETKFNITVQDEDAEKIITVQDLVNYVEERIAAFKP
jgi:acyl carrier protein